MNNFNNSLRMSFSDINCQNNSVTYANMCGRAADPGWFCAYTIEEHLRQFRDFEQFRMLYNCWMIDKQEQIGRLSTVAMTYPTFSLHDASHSETILRQIACFLGRERVCQLSPTDAWLLLEAAYYHDYGMVVTAQDLYRELTQMSKAEFENFSASMDKSESYEVRSSWAYLKPLFLHGRKTDKKNGVSWDAQKENAEQDRNLDNLRNIFGSAWYDWPYYFTKSFGLVIQEFCRPRHPEMSRKKIKAEAEEKTYEGIIPIRLRYLISDIAAIHGEDREALIRKLPQKILGYGGDYAHPRFVAELIRIGDLLDMDNNRFNQYQLAVAGNVNYSSFVHQLKHKALRDFLITPEKIVVTADFTDEDVRRILQGTSLEVSWKKSKEEKADKNRDKRKEGGNREKEYCGQEEGVPENQAEQEEWEKTLCLRAYKEMSGWLKMLHEELDFFRKEWLQIVPEGLDGNCPYFEPESLHINGRFVEPDLINLCYHITPKRASEIIEGSGLYEEISVAFIREIVQNSMDATKRKVDNMLFQDGRNDESFKNPFEFYRYILHDLEQLAISISFKSCGDSCVRCKIRDQGIGISGKMLKQMQYIGDISDYETALQAKYMPAWWKPTGSFGIGMQTIFYYAKTFSLTTRTRSENILRKMRFYSTQNGGKIDAYEIEDEVKKGEFGYGTEIIVDIPMQTINSFQRREKLGRNKDYFGNAAQMYQQQIKDTILEVCGSFGIPVVVNLPMEDKNGIRGYLDENKYLSYCFGTYFLDLDADSIVKVTEHEVRKVWEYSGFSCWSKKNKILIRYRWPKNPREENISKIYFNEIRVEDDDLSNAFRIPFFETEVYLFGENAGDYLEINRDSFLYEMRGTIVERICATHLACLAFLLSKKEEDGYIEAIWKEKKVPTLESEAESAKQTKSKETQGIKKEEEERTEERENKAGEEWSRYQQSARDYCSCFLLHGELQCLNTGINWFVQYGDIISHLREETLGEYGSIYKKAGNNIWLINNRSSYIGDSRLRDSEKGKIRYIAEDAFFCYKNLAVTELVCMQGFYHSYIVVYKTQKRAGKPVRMEELSFKQYIRMRYKELCQRGHWQMRMLLPGIEEYRTLCVGELLDNLGTMFEKKWDSAIILPMTIKELDNFMKEEDEKVREEMIEEACTQNNSSSYGEIQKYIENHGICRNPGKDKILAQYRQLLREIWEILRG